jgi:hypothetical protein
MSDETPVYSHGYIRAWTGLTIAVALVFFGMFVFGPFLMFKIGEPIWALLRWIVSPII